MLLYELAIEEVNFNICRPRSFLTSDGLFLSRKCIRDMSIKPFIMAYALDKNVLIDIRSFDGFSPTRTMPFSSADHYCKRHTIQVCFNNKDNKGQFTLNGFMPSLIQIICLHRMITYENGQMRKDLLTAGVLEQCNYYSNNPCDENYFGNVWSSSKYDNGYNMIFGGEPSPSHFSKNKSGMEEAKVIQFYTIK